MSHSVDWDATLSDALQAIADNPGDRRAHLQRIQATLALGRPALARRLLDAYLRSAPDDPRALDLHAAASLILGEADQAAESAAAALAIDPEYSPASYNLACALARLGRPAEAIEALGRAIEADPDLRAMAAEDEDLAGLRAEPLFRELVDAPLAAGGSSSADS